MRTGLLLIVALLVTPGCGAKKKSEHAKFVEQADAVCAKWGQALRQIPQPPDPTAPVQVAPYLQRLVPLMRRQNAELARIRPPAKDASNMQLFISTQEAQVFFAGRARAEAARGNKSRMQFELRRWQAAIAQAAQVGNEFGFKVCTGTSSGSASRR
jgi:hypothetical protein